MRAATSNPTHADQRTYCSIKQLRPGVLMLNIAAARLAPACWTKSGTPRPATGGRCVAAAVEADVIMRTPVALSRFPSRLGRSSQNRLFLEGLNRAIFTPRFKHLQGAFW